MNKNSRTIRFIVLMAVLTIFLLIPWVVPNPRYVLHLMIMFFLWAAFASVWDFQLGCSGIFAFGPLAFFALGGYTSALLSLGGVNPWLTIWIGGLIAAAFSFLIGSLTLRLKGIYICLLTMCFQEILRIFCINNPFTTGGGGEGVGIVGWYYRGSPGGSVTFIGTGGFNGITFIPSLVPKWFDSRIANYYIIFLFFVLILFILYKTLKSPIGYAIISIRDSEKLASSIGINLYKYKLIVFLITGFFMGLLGAYYAHYLRCISPIVMNPDQLLMLLDMIVVGGSGIFFGPVAGAAIITIINELVLSWQQYRLFFFGIVLILFVLIFPSGVVGFLKGKKKR